MKKTVRLIFIVLCIVMFGWFFGPLAGNGIINLGNGTGMVLSAGALLLLIKPQMMKNLWKKPLGKTAIITVSVILVFAIGFSAVATVNMIITNNTLPDAESTVIVLGCQVRQDGPSLMLKYRLDAAYEYLMQNKDAVCILSGGQGKDEPMPEGEYMYKYLANKGISLNRLYMETRSASTRENLEFSMDIIKKQNLNKKITVITNNFHTYRARYMAKTLGMECTAVPAKSHLGLLPTYYIREMYCLLYDMIFE